MSDELIERCKVCNGFLSADIPGHYKSPDEQFVHKECHDNPESDKVVLDMTDKYLSKTHVPTQFNCGHIVQGPPIDTPSECPECGVQAP